MKRILLKAGVRDSLDWSSEIEVAADATSILWQLDLGLFDKLSEPLEDEQQFRTLSLAIEHFKKTVWPQFAERSLGVSLYQGSPDFARNFQWSDLQKEQFESWKDKGDASLAQLLFCRDVCAQFLTMLASRLPDDAEAFMEIDSDHSLDEWELVQVLRSDAFPYLKALTSPLAHEAESPIGICLPSFQEATKISVEQWRTVTQGLSGYRLVPEAEITTSWTELDELLVFSEYMSHQGFRMLQGFCAAGGRVVTIGPKLGLEDEVSWEIYAQKAPI